MQTQRSGYSHFAVFAAHSFTSFRNCFNAATPIPAIRSLHLIRSCIRKTQPHIFNFFIISKISPFIRNTKILCYEKHGFYLYVSSRKLTFFDFYEKTAASAIRIVLYSIPSGETASRSLSVPLTVIFCPGSMPETFVLSNSSPWAQHARTSVIMQ